jgi:hypothetical protein
MQPTPWQIYMTYSKLSFSPSTSFLLPRVKVCHSPSAVVLLLVTGVTIKNERPFPEARGLQLLGRAAEKFLIDRGVASRVA